MAGFRGGGKAPGPVTPLPAQFVHAHWPRNHRSVFHPESPADRCFLLRNSAVSGVRPGIRKILRLAAGFHREIFRDCEKKSVNKILL